MVQKNFQYLIFPLSTKLTSHLITNHLDNFKILSPNKSLIFFLHFSFFWKNSTVFIGDICLLQIEMMMKSLFCTHMCDVWERWISKPAKTNGTYAYIEVTLLIVILIIIFKIHFFLPFHFSLRTLVWSPFLRFFSMWCGGSDIYIKFTRACTCAHTLLLYSFYFLQPPLPLFFKTARNSIESRFSIHQNRLAHITSIFSYVMYINYKGLSSSINRKNVGKMRSFFFLRLYRFFFAKNMAAIRHTLSSSHHHCRRKNISHMKTQAHTHTFTLFSFTVGYITGWAFYNKNSLRSRNTLITYLRVFIPYRIKPWPSSVLNVDVFIFRGLRSCKKGQSSSEVTK